MAGTGHDVAKRDDHSPATVDPQDEPSAEWGWHGSFPKGALIMGWVSAVIILLMLIGNHEGRVEDIWLVGTGVVMILLLIRHSIRARRSWRR
nr:DUF2631 domain-containing protein [Pseudonocardia spinosispora]